MAKNRYFLISLGLMLFYTIYQIILGIDLTSVSYTHLKITIEERKEIVEYCLSHNRDYKGTAHLYLMRFTIHGPVECRANTTTYALDNFVSCYYLVSFDIFIDNFLLKC